MNDRRPGEGRYAHLEREQRWLLGAVPPGTRPVATIVDRYVTGTRLRLRRSEADGEVVLKLGQKVRAEPAHPEIAKMTTVYLSPDEYEVLACLPASELRKERGHAMVDDHVVAVDRFRGRLDGLVLAEVELDIGEPRLARPRFAVLDVTDDDRFTGGALASASDAEVIALLDEVGRITR